MSDIHVGDTVRYLNAVGGGRVVRIDGRMAYVEEDGFETPVLINECVVVARAGDKPTTTHFKPIPPAAESKAAPEPETPKRFVIEEPEEPIEEIEGNDKLNAVIAFEPRNPKSLSTTTYDAFFVNDSNYYLDVVVATAEARSSNYMLLRHITVEPNMQVLLAELAREEVGKMEKFMVQWVAWKEGKPFEVKSPGWVERRLDTVKFFKVHCFKPSEYFDTPVIEISLVKDDIVQASPAEASAKAEETAKLNALQEAFSQESRRKARPVQRREPRPRPKPQPSEYKPNDKGIIEVDLHSYELLDTTRGLSNADILNRQIDEFDRVMRDNLRNHGQKIVFIHGKGEGVLRQAIMKELTHRYKDKVETQDASFREYGFGATQVTIR